MASTYISLPAASSSTLPAGAATAANQVIQIAAEQATQASVASIDTKTPALGQALAAGSVPVVLTAAQLSTLTPLSTVTVVQPTGTNLHVVVDSPSLPTGAATAANQTTQITAEQAIQASVASIDTKTPALGQALAAASTPVVLTAAQLSTLTPLTSVTVTQATGTNLHAVLDSGSTTTVTQATGTNLHTVVDGGSITTTQGTSPWVNNISQFGGSNVVTGTGASGAGIPRVTVSNDSNVIVSQSTAANLNATVVGSGSAGTASAGVVTVQGIASMTPVQVSQATASNLNATVVQATGTNLHTVVDSGSITVTQGTGTNLHTVVDSGTLTAVTSITNALPAGTNLLGKVGIDQTTVGTTNAISLAQLGANAVAVNNGTASTGTLRVAIASDNTSNTNPFLVGEQKAATSTLTNVSGSASSVSILASNANRKGAMITNDSGAILYLKFGTTASTTSYTVQMPAGSYYEFPANPGLYTGAVDGIWSSATGAARITELT